MSKKRLFARLELHGEIAEVSSRMPLLGRHRQTVLRDLLVALRAARKHPRVFKVLVVVRSLGAGWGQIDEIRSAFQSLREAGKEVLVYLESGGDNRSLYLASAGSRILIPPSASVDLVGIRSENLYLREFLDSVGVLPQVISIGDYKSAGEFLSRSGMSEPSREMVTSILEDYTDRLVEGLAEQRGLEPKTIRTLIDDGPFSAQRAAREGLVDELVYEDELEKRLSSETPPLAKVDIRKLAPRRGFIRRLLLWRRPRIAQIVVDGVIAYGEARGGPGPINVAGSAELIEVIRSARKSKRVKAVLVRVNSPGGSGLASDLIWRELKVTNQKKPVIVSLADTAASGGYYIAAAGRRIFADPGTLTGSIGVIGGKLSFENLLARLRVKVDGVETGRHSGYGSPSRPFTDREEQILREQMSDFYESLFLVKVADNRKMLVDELRPLAGGRVWTGAQAKQRGLVDELGGIEAALEAARQAAGLEKGRYRLVTHVPRRRLRDLIRFGFGSSVTRERVYLLWFDAMRIR
jgi:protease-4